MVKLVIHKGFVILTLSILILYALLYTTIQYMSIGNVSYISNMVYHVAVYM